MIHMSYYLHLQSTLLHSEKNQRQTYRLTLNLTPPLPSGVRSRRRLKSPKCCAAWRRGSGPGDRFMEGLGPYLAVEFFVNSIDWKQLHGRYIFANGKGHSKRGCFLSPLPFYCSLLFFFLSFIYPGPVLWSRSPVVSWSHGPMVTSENPHGYLRKCSRGFCSCKPVRYTDETKGWHWYMKSQNITATDRIG